MSGISNEQVEEAIEKLRVSFGYPTKKDFIRELVNRFLNWKLPRDFSARIESIIGLYWLLS